MHLHICKLHIVYVPRDTVEVFINTECVGSLICSISAHGTWKKKLMIRHVLLIAFMRYVSVLKMHKISFYSFAFAFNCL